MAEGSSWQRKALRTAERALSDPGAKQELADAGIELGESEPVDMAELLAAMDDGESSPSIEVTIYFDDTPVSDRGVIEDPLTDYIEGQGIGSWVGSGQGSIGDRSFFDITFSVNDLAEAVDAVRQRLRELYAGPSTTISASDGTEYRL